MKRNFKLYWTYPFLGPLRSKRGFYKMWSICVAGEKTASLVSTKFKINTLNKPSWEGRIGCRPSRGHGELGRRPTEVGYP